MKLESLFPHVFISLLDKFSITVCLCRTIVIALMQWCYSVNVLKYTKVLSKCQCVLQFMCNVEKNTPVVSKTRHMLDHIRVSMIKISQKGFCMQLDININNN